MAKAKRMLSGDDDLGRASKGKLKGRYAGKKMVSKKTCVHQGGKKKGKLKKGCMWGKGKYKGKVFKKIGK